MYGMISHRLAIATVFWFASSLAAQVSSEEHASHHPEDSTLENGVSHDSEDAEPSASSGGMGAGMGAMMEQMGVPPPMDLYPSLMNMPGLMPEEYQEIEQRSKERVQSGLALMTEAIDQMSRASSENDFVSMQATSVLFREGFAKFESGLATRQLLIEGQQPQQIALNWFRREMNIEPQSPVLVGYGSGPMGLSWFHFGTMIVLVGFGTSTIVMYYFKMRRASTLIKRLTDSQQKLTTDA